MECVPQGGRELLNPLGPRRRFLVGAGVEVGFEASHVILSISEQLEVKLSLGVGGLGGGLITDSTPSLRCKLSKST